MSFPKPPQIFTIPPGLPFVEIMARDLIDRTAAAPSALASYQILLPTRRACRALRDAFLKISGGKPLILPRLQPIGDVDEEELAFSIAGPFELEVPPAISPLSRQIMLANVIAHLPGFSKGIEQDLALATALGRLMDQVYTEDLSLEDLPHIVDKEAFATHWQITLDFLSILSEHWPRILAENGVIDAADRRNRLLKILVQHWQENPPAHPVIAAGSTGSIPAMGALLSVIARLPQGCVLLPGLDQSVDRESWEKMGPTHPQAALKQLLQRMDVPRENVKLWPTAEQHADYQKVKDSARLFSEVMRPAETTEQWNELAVASWQKSIPSLDIQLYECAHLQEEALTIAARLRHALETPTQTAALVTPDRALARRVAMACRRWGIEIDDSGGRILPDTRVGSFLLLGMETLIEDFRPVSFLTFLKHTLSAPAFFESEWREKIRLLDRFILRGPIAGEGTGWIEDKLRQSQSVPEADRQGLRILMQAVFDSFAPLRALAEQEEADGAAWIDAHIQMSEFFCPPDRLWSQDDGEEAARFFAELKDHAALMPRMNARDYAGFLRQAMGTLTIRPAYGLHPRLMILGQMEARLVNADVMILSGLNEGTWPQDPSIDPWMSRQMRQKFGLPPLDRTIGVAAHDFCQAACAKEIILTRALRVGKAPTVPSRWLQRLDTVLEAMGLNPQILRKGPYQAYARLLDQATDFTPYQRPEPRPPLSSRPRTLPVTDIEQWLKDPYGLYAKKILSLKPLKPLEQPLDAALRGTLIHETLHRFVVEFPKDVHDDADVRFLQIAREELAKFSKDPAIWNFWQPRLKQVGDWLVSHEQNWRTDRQPAAQEAQGTLSFAIDAGPEPFILTARADRIDRGRDGTGGAVIDYKTGGTFSMKGLKTGEHPQLPLEALILREGGFENLPALIPDHLAYWVLKGGRTVADITKLDGEEAVAETIETAAHSLRILIETFAQEDTPYYSLPHPDKAPRFNDYEHLARVKEWTALDAQEDGV